jgi:hypothetical protein
MDFTLKTYKRLLEALKDNFHRFYGFGELIAEDPDRYIVLRHDVDRKPFNAMALAEIEAAHGIRASYHLRIGIIANHYSVLQELADMGHEVAYHYEDLSAVCNNHRRAGGNLSEEIIQEAVERFHVNLRFFRKSYPVNIISMHGSPLSAIDNRLLWKYYDYRGDGIVCEPYFDIDVSDLLYLTDTGRRWDGEKSNIRDRGRHFPASIKGDPYAEWMTRPVRGSLMCMTDEGKAFRAGNRIRTTDDIIALASVKKLPQKVIINTHPQRWTDKPLPWINEFVFQSLKNQIKTVIRTNKTL